MALYKFFSCNVEVQYKGYFLSKAMLFTLFTTLLTIILPFIIAYRGRGLWLRSNSFYEQPQVHFNYEYLIVVETDDPSQPIVCGEGVSLDSMLTSEENCSEFLVDESKCNSDERNCRLNLKAHINIPGDRVATSVLMIVGLDFQMAHTCPLHMQSLAVINRELVAPTTSVKYYGDLELYQTKHLPCFKNVVDNRYNSSLLALAKPSKENIVDSIIDQYFEREVTTKTKTSSSRVQHGSTGSLSLNVHLRIPEMKVVYTPSFLQELKWAWPQYLSFVVIFYWVFNRIKRFVFNNRLLMAWEVVPWKRRD